MTISRSNKAALPRRRPAMAALLAGAVPLMVDRSASALPQIRAGRVIVLAVASEHHSTLMPEVPTAAAHRIGTEAMPVRREEFRASTVAELAKWHEVARAANLKLD